MSRLLQHGKVRLVLHELRGGDNPTLLVLHGLGERSPEAVPEHAAGWPGPVFALDFTGHGESSVPAGGGYTCEVLMADADAALAELGPMTLLGRGLGAYVALLLAGARPAEVRGAVLVDGPGLFGGPPGPSSPAIVQLPGPSPVTPDPYAIIELTRDVRPPDYAATFARQAAASSPLETPLTVSTVGRPPWLEAVAAEVGVAEAPAAEALAGYAAGALH
jgi:pimeloyl-ACP methyl ester carboxylesterase